MPHHCGRSHSNHFRPEPRPLDRPAPPRKPTHEEVAALAFSYWEARGKHGGSPWEDWFRAEQELDAHRDSGG